MTKYRRGEVRSIERKIFENRRRKKGEKEYPFETVLNGGWKRKKKDIY